MGKDPVSGDVFINRRATHIKLLHWEFGGLVIYYKHLEKGTFSLPKLESGTVSWIYHSLIDGNIVFDYQPTRGQKASEAMLQYFKGYLQTDGYAVYDHYAKKKGVTHLGCWAHARRYYERGFGK